MQFRRAKPSNRFHVVPLIGLVLLILHNIRNSKTKAPLSQTASKVKINKELLPVYELPPTFSEEPTHLAPIDPSILIRNGSYPIDFTHRNGYLHTGGILYVMDSSGEILFLQRSADMVTCPSAWSILGEHSIAGEEIIETVVRGLEEELGFTSLGYKKGDSPGTWTAELRANKLKGSFHIPRESLHVTIQNVTQFPLYYIRHYGPRNDNRIDSQLTFLFSVQFPKMHEEIELEWKLDDEVADHRWMSLEGVRTWISDDATINNKVFKSDGGVRDDGPDEGDFCHGTVRSLHQAGLKSMMSLQEEYSQLLQRI
ncbi:hypothetical protein ACHAXR_012472 [Thalassiosira sp. AJA248-18]